MRFAFSSNNAVPAARRGRVAGAISTAEAVAKGSGPVTSSLLFYASIRRGRAGHAAVFLGLAALYATTGFLARSLQAFIDDPEALAKEAALERPAGDLSDAV